MRLLVSNVFFNPQSIGGATRVVEDNISAFNKDARISETAVFCSLNGSPKPYITRNYRVGKTLVQSVATQPIANSDFIISDKKIRERFSSFVDYYCPDLIHFHCIQRLSSEIVLEAKDREIPYLITMHDGWWISDYQFLIDKTGVVRTYNYNDPEVTRHLFGDRAVIRQAALRSALEGAAKVLTVSDAFREVIENTGLTDIGVIENGVTEFDVLPKVPTDKVTIGYLAGVSHAKGYYELRAALSRGEYPNLKLILIDHSLPKASSITEYWGTTEVERTGFIPQAEIAELFQRLNVVIVPSLWPESFGLVAREALRTECWLLASNRGAAASDVVENENGHKFDPGNSVEWNQLLTRVNDNPDRYKQPCSQIKISGSDKQANELVELYYRLATG